MIRGTVNEHLEAVLRLHVYSDDGVEHEIEGVVDTGYDGWLTLPRAVIAVLVSLPPLSPPVQEGDYSCNFINTF